MSSPALAELQHLRRLGFHDEPILAEDGTVDVVYFARRRRGWREVVLVYGEHRARAYRIRPRAGADNPLHVEPAAVDGLIQPGDVVTVVHALLSDRRTP
jgi:hypothetical protein